MRRFRFVWIILVAVLFLSMVSSFAYAGTVDLPKTGQKACYDAGGIEIPCANTGQDGEKRAGVAWLDPRFTDNGNGTVTDNLTGLIWLKDANCTETVGGVNKSGGTITWENALTWTNNLKSGDCGLTDGSNEGDWRLPNVNELKSLVHWGQANTATWLNLNTQGFTNVQSSLYWSSSTNAINTNIACFVNMWRGLVLYDDKDYDGHYVWPVRGTTSTPAKVWQTGQTTSYATGDDGDLKRGVEWPSPRFTVSGDCVTDNLTGLMWAKDGNLPNGTKKWQDALDYVAWLNTPVGSDGGGLCGYNDWRLPNVNELKSLVHRGEANTATWLISQGFTNVQSDGYWSSSTHASYTASAWYVSMWFCFVSNFNKYYFNNYVWPVRAGQVGNLVNLFISKDGAGTGTVTSSPGEINYGSVRQDMFESGTEVTLTANPNSDSVFTSWSQNCLSCGTTNPCYITMDVHKQCTANFGIKRTLTVTKTGTGTGTVTAGANCTLNWVGNTGTCSVADGTAITLTATADGGSTFTGWSEGTGSAAGCNGAGACNFNINANSSVTATFSEDPPPPPPPPPSCTYTIDPTSKNFAYQGGSGSITVTKTIIECEPDSWTSTASDNWITVTSGSSGSGNGTVGYTVSENKTNSSRTGTITIAGNTFTITQDKASGKIISVSPTSVNFGSVKTGVMVTKQVTITNLGTDTITIGTVSITGTDAGCHLSHYFD